MCCLYTGCSLEVTERILDAQIKKYRTAAFAESSKASYRTQLKTYLRFCELMEYDPVPIVSEHLYRYVAFLATFLKFRSVRQYLNIV